jgi:hypothetical protein
MRKIVLIAFITLIVSIVVLGVLYFTVGLPDYSGERDETAVVSQLRRGAGKSDVIALLDRKHIAWAEGLNWQGCPASYDRCIGDFPNFGLEPRCHSGCDRNIVQAAFASHVSPCYDEGDVLTMEFWDDGSLRDWRVERAAGGHC